MKKKGNSGLMLIALISMVLIMFSSCKKKGSDEDPQPMHVYDVFLQGTDSVECTMVSDTKVSTEIPGNTNQVLTDSGYVWKKWVKNYNEGTGETRVSIKCKSDTHLTLYVSYNEAAFGGPMRILVYYDGDYIGNGIEYIHSGSNRPLN